MGLSKLKLCSLNARGLRNKFKRVSLFKYLKSQKFDVICLQETHVTPNDFDCWQKQWGGQCFFNQGTARSKGEAILISKHFTGEVALIDQSERLQIVSLKQDQLDVTIANVYAPNNTIDKPEFLNTLVEKLENFSDNTILCGDFNTTLNTDLDILSGQPHPQIEVESLNNFINIMSLTDVWRHFHPNEKEYTWCRHNPFIARRLDYCFVSEGILSSCTDCEHQFVPNTDHKAVVLNINDNDFKRGPGYYKFNNSYLREKDFLDKMNNFLQNYIQESEQTDISNIDKWEMCKIKIRNFSIEYGKKKKIQQKNELLSLYVKLKDLDKKKLLINQIVVNYKKCY